MKKASILFVILLVLTWVAGCGPSTPPADDPIPGNDDEPFESAWEISVGDKVFAIEDIRKMENVTIEAEKKGETNSYTGVRLSLLLTEAGITDFATLTLEAEDGYSADITREEALDDNSILCFALDGEDLSSEKNAPLMFVSPAASSKAWVGKLKTIRVGK